MHSRYMQSKTLIFYLATFDTYQAAREAEKIAENFSTLSVHERNKSKKRQRNKPGHSKTKIVKIESNVGESAIK